MPASKAHNRLAGTRRAISRQVLAPLLLLALQPALAQDLRLPVLPALGGDRALSRGSAASEAVDAAMPPAARAVWTDGSERLVEAEWLAALRRLDPDVSAFLADTKTRIVFSEPRPGLFDQNGMQIAQYESGAIYVNLAQLRDYARPVLERAPAADAIRHLALLTLPIVSHEARHGISRREIVKRLGKDYPFGSQEDEIVAFAHQALVTRRLYAAHGRELARYEAHPMALNNRMLLLKLRMGGVTGGEGVFGGIDSFVRSAPGYQHHPSMASVRPAAYLAGPIARIEESNLALRRRIAGTLESLASQPETEASTRRRAGLGSLSETVERELGKVEQARAVLSDAELFRSLQSYYAETIAALHASALRSADAD